MNTSPTARDRARPARSPPLPPQPPPPRLSVVVPTYQGARSLPALCARVAAVCEARGEPWELVVVDDASPDDTPAVADALAAVQPQLRYRRLPVRSGQHRATAIGMAEARGAVIVTIDDDLQQPPESIPSLLAALRPGVQVAMARFPNPAHPPWRRLGSRAVGLLMPRPAPGSPALAVTSFKAFRREAARQVLGQIPSQGPFYLARVMFAALPPGSVANVDVPHHRRRHGRSGYGLAHLARLAWRALTQPSGTPR